MRLRMNIHGLNKLTLLDYPGRMACLIFTGACNYRCPFCHNASLVLNPAGQPVIREEELFSFLQSRRGILEGVCISGGEPTLQADLPEFIRKIKSLGYLVKLDTNGSRPGVLEALLKEGLLDYVAMDIKNAPGEYLRTIGIPDKPKKTGDESQESGDESLIVTSVKQSAALLMNSDIPYEFRTTVIKELHTKETLMAIGQWLRGARAYYLQAFRDSETLVGAPCGQFHAYSKEEMQEFCSLLSPWMETVGLRGVD